MSDPGPVSSPLEMLRTKINVKVASKLQKQVYVSLEYPEHDVQCGIVSGGLTA